MNPIFVFLSIFFFCGHRLSRAQEGGDETPREHHVSTRINFVLPKSLSQTDGYEHTDALFGVPFQKNHVISGPVYYMTPDASDQAPGCDKYNVTINEDFSVGYQIFLVDRGTCTFSQKIRVAQADGAEAVIVANTICIQSDFAKLEKANNKSVARQWCCPGGSCEKEEFYEYLPFMASSGNKFTDLSITIPAIMITLYDSLRVKQMLCRQEMLKERTSCMNVSHLKFIETSGDSSAKSVVAEIRLDTPHPDGRVEYELWMKSDAPPEFLQSFEWFSQALHKTTLFSPKYIVVNGKETYLCADPSFCSFFCISEGEYCAIPEAPERTGPEVLAENVRQYCIWKQESATFEQNGAPMWWKYQDQYREKECATQNTEDDFVACSKSIINAFPRSFDRNAYSKCVQDEVSILKELRDDQESKGIFTTSMIVNTRILHFSMTTPLLASVICDGYMAGAQPGICSCVSEAATDNDMARCQLCLEKGECSDVPVSRGFSFFSVMMIILFTVTLVAAVAYVYTKQAKKQMQNDVRNILAEYMPLDDVNHATSNFAPASGGRGREDVNLI